MILALLQDYAHFYFSRLSLKLRSCSVSTNILFVDKVVFVQQLSKENKPLKRFFVTFCIVFVSCKYLIHEPYILTLLERIVMIIRLSTQYVIKIIMITIALELLSSLRTTTMKSATVAKLKKERFIRKNWIQRIPYY